MIMFSGPSEGWRDGRDPIAAVMAAAEARPELVRDPAQAARTSTG